MRIAFVKLSQTLMPSVLAAVFVAACANGAGTPASGFAASDAQSLSTAYRLGIGDKLRIVVFGEENLSGDTEVNAGGSVALPLIGDVAAKGRHISEFRRDVTRRLSNGYLKAPNVTVEVINYRPIYVHGEVKNGGEFPYRTSIKVRDAIATAGGYTYRANKGFVYLVRNGRPEIKLSLASDMPVMPGDNIRVPERFF